MTSNEPEIFLFLLNWRRLSVDVQVAETAAAFYGSLPERFPGPAALDELL